MPGLSCVSGYEEGMAHMSGYQCNAMPCLPVIQYHIAYSELLLYISHSPVFPNPGPPVPPTLHFIVDLDEHTSFNSLRAWWLVNKLNQVCLSRVTITMCTVGGTGGPGLENTDLAYPELLLPFLLSVTARINTMSHLSVYEVKWNQINEWNNLN
jgi:hypothetical protein